MMTYDDVDDICNKLVSIIGHFDDDIILAYTTSSPSPSP